VAAYLAGLADIDKFEAEAADRIIRRNHGGTATPEGERGLRDAACEGPGSNVRSGSSVTDVARLDHGRCLGLDRPGRAPQ